MTTVGSYEAKTHLSSLLDRVAKGESITITRHGTPMAVLQPFGAGPKPDPVTAIEHMRAFRRKHPLKGLSIREMIEEGRR
jgi:prevent-host-death family protein